MKKFIKKQILKHIKVPPAPAMKIDNVYAYLDALHQKRDIAGPVVEVGVATGGTTALACRFLSRLKASKEYYCLDTYSGFVQSQLETDHKLGLTPEHDRMFSDNSLDNVRNNLRGWGIQRNINFVQGDICTMDEAKIPDGISVCLLDVDLRDPIYEGLKRLRPKMADGGIILVDDCKASTSWVGANVGYSDYVKEVGLEPRYYMGFGLVEVASKPGLSIDWECSPEPIEAGGSFYCR